MPLIAYLESVDHYEHMLRVAQLTYQPYPDIGKALGYLVQISAQLSSGYPHISKSRELELVAYDQEMRKDKMSDHEVNILAAFVGAEAAEKARKGIKDE